MEFRLQHQKEINEDEDDAAYDDCDDSRELQETTTTTAVEEWLTKLTCVDSNFFASIWTA